MSGHQTLEPLSKHEKVIPLAISLRGRLASKYYQLLSDNAEGDAQSLIQNLLASDDPNILKCMDDNSIVIGLLADRGKYYPDW